MEWKSFVGTRVGYAKPISTPNLEKLGTLHFKLQIKYALWLLSGFLSTISMLA
jgi:hypothetical protein